MGKDSPALRNKTIKISNEELNKFNKRLITLNKKATTKEFINKTINQDVFSAIDFLPDNFVDLLFIDPPYNMNKIFGVSKFKESSVEKYTEWLDHLISKLERILKKDASIYVCGDWKSSTSIHIVLSKYFTVRNRITWEREKGRGAKSNWKSNSEDIWFCTKSNNYYFDPESVKLKRKVIAPYKNKEGLPKDWKETSNGSFRLTYPSNLWNDISVPFWSMSENTDHPTQKPEKLLAKLILASSKSGDIVFDPFLGSGTTSVTAKKLGRKYLGIEIDKNFACIAEKRLELAKSDRTIQGYKDGVFWERNSIKFNNKRNIREPELPLIL